jgi:hypothetical protein
LVAATLERQWEEALRRQREAQEGYDRFGRQALPKLSQEEQSRIAALATDIPALWHSAATTNRDRQAVIRCLVESVRVHVERDSEHARATIHWAGGHESGVEFVRPVRSYAHLRDGAVLKERVVTLRAEGKSAAEVADALNGEGWSPIKPGERFTADVVRGLFRELGIRGEIKDDTLLGAGEWWIHDLADEVPMCWELLRVWSIRGWVHARQTKVQRLWIIWADRDELKRLRKLRALMYPGRNHFPEELTTPKQRSRNA